MNPCRWSVKELNPWLADLLGTALLVLIGPGAVMVSASTNLFGNAGVAIAFGIAVSLAIMLAGPSSGAHINPAVTIALWSTRRFSAQHVIPYLLAQCIGALLAAMLLLALLGTVGNGGATLPSVNINAAFAIEAGYSGILILVVLMVSDAEWISRRLVPFIIGATVAAGAFATGPLTGGSFNPARTFGPAVASGIWNHHWLYWVAPVAGMLAGAGFHTLFRAWQPIAERKTP
jgi:MIP family channel proteins